MTLPERVRQANRPGPAEDSVVFRAATTGAVITGVAACWAQGELAGWVMAGSITAILAGNVVSYRRRSRPVPGLKLVLAFAVAAAFVWFLLSVSGRTTLGDLSAVEGPLAVLFTWVQVTHAFDVPSRRDLGFSLAGSATLMAVAAAQAVDTTFGLYVVVWASFGVAGLSSMWSSMAGGSPPGLRAVASSSTAVLTVGLGLVWLLPAPHASSSIVFPSSLAGDVPLGSQSGLVGGGPNGSEPVHPGSPAGPDRVGGLLGFAGPLNTAIRGSLGDQIVLRVRADRPSFWIAETFNQWDGRSWTQWTPPGRAPFRPLTFGPPFTVPFPSDEPGAGPVDIQTFYLARASANLIFHAAEATQVWFPAGRLFVSDDGTIRSGTTMGPGSVYTVESAVNAASAAELRQSPAAPGAGLPGTLAVDTRLPHPYPRVRALAELVTAGHAGTYDKVTALISWIGSHTRYTTDIPPLAPGDDTVSAFLFGNRRGYCEQISTALAVMLRSLGIPVREATGYVPDSFNPITDLYEVRARDAHAWVQVWFPGHGWQSFDPTASVPAANPTPGGALAHDINRTLRRVPAVPVVAAAGVTGILFLVRRRRRLAPPTWAAGITRELVRTARRRGVVVGPGEALETVAAQIDRGWARHAAPVPDARALARHAARAAYGDGAPGPEDRRALSKAARRMRRRVRWGSGRSGRSRRFAPSRGAGRHARPTASDSSHDAPVSRRGR